MADTTARAGAATVSVTGLRAFEDAVRAAAASTTEDVLHDEVSRLVDDARERWPVKTGRSLRGLGVDRASGTALASVVARNVVPYAGDVRIAGHTVPAWRELVEAPIEAAARELEDQVVRALDRELQRALDRRG